MLGSIPNASIVLLSEPILKEADPNTGFIANIIHFGNKILLDPGFETQFEIHLVHECELSTIWVGDDHPLMSKMLEVEHAITR